MKTEMLYRGRGSEKQRAFHAKLVPNLDLPIYGLKIPELREIAKGLDNPDLEIKYHEDVLLRGFIICRMKCPIEEKIRLIDSQLPLLSTWDETDTFASSLKFGKKEMERAFAYFTSLLQNDGIYVRRLAVVWIMANRKKLETPYKQQLELIAKVRNDDYYIAMAIAWALSFYYIDDPDTATGYIENSDEMIKKMAKQKIRDSRRVKRCLD